MSRMVLVVMVRRTEERMRVKRAWSRARVSGVMEGEGGGRAMKRSVRAWM